MPGSPVSSTTLQLASHGFATVGINVTKNEIPNSGHNARRCALCAPSFLDMDAWMTAQLNVALIRKLRGSLMCLADCFDMLMHGCLYNQALADISVTGAGINCLSCIEGLQTAVNKSVSVVLSVVHTCYTYKSVLTS